MRTALWGEPLEPPWFLCCDISKMVVVCAPTRRGSLNELSYLSKNGILGSRLGSGVEEFAFVGCKSPAVQLDNVGQLCVSSLPQAASPIISLSFYSLQLFLTLKMDVERGRDFQKELVLEHDVETS